MSCMDCGTPHTVALVHWPAPRKEGPYLMCAMCAWHSVKNRGGQLAGLSVPEPAAFLLGIDRIDWREGAHALARQN